MAGFGKPNQNVYQHAKTTFDKKNDNIYANGLSVLSDHLGPVDHGRNGRR
jgi:hypothetical protein